MCVGHLQTLHSFTKGVRAPADLVFVKVWHHLCLLRTNVNPHNCTDYEVDAVGIGQSGSGQVLGDFGALLSSWTHYQEGSRPAVVLQSGLEGLEIEIAICKVGFRSHLRGQSCGESRIKIPAIGL